MANSFIGKAISLLSHSDVRYRGILAGLDPSNSTIQLQNVYSMGTENRRPPDEYIPPADLPYQFIIFRASEVKDIALDNEPMPTRVRSVHDDPAVIGASGPPISNGTYGQYPVPAQNGVTPPPPSQQVPATLGQRPPVVGVPQPVAGQGAQVQTGQPGEQQQPKQGQSQPNTTTASGRTSSNSRRANNGSVANATASIEKVERAISEVRLSNTNARSKKHGGGQHQQHSELTVPKTDFDFQSSNARFDKAALASQAGVATTGAGGQARIGDESDTNTNPSEDDGDKAAAAAAANKSPKEKEPSYNPKKSFFDNLSSSASSAPPSGGGGGGRGRGRGGGGKSRREEEREKNVATFGEPGGVGLMGPGAYVGGYGHGRRGGRGGRRGGGGRRNPSGAHQHQQ